MKLRTPDRAPAGAGGPAARISDFAVLGRLLSEARGYWRYVAILLLLNLLAAPLALLTPLPLKLVVDNVLGAEPLPGFVAAAIPQSWAGSPQTLLIFAVIVLICVMAFIQVQTACTRVLRMWVGERLVVKFRSRLFEQSQRMSLAYHDVRGTSDSLYRIQYDAPAIQWVILDGIIPVVTATITLLSMIWVTARIDTVLALVAIMVAPVLVILTTVYRGPLRERWRKVARLDSGAMAVVSETLAALRVVKAFVQEEREQRRFDQRSGETVHAKVDAALFQGSFDILVGSTVAVGTAAVLFIGTQGVREGTLSLGNLLVVMAYLSLLYGPLRTIGQQFAGLQRYLASAERTFVLLDEHQDVPERAHAMSLERAEGRLELQGVHFGYEPSEEVLSGVSLKIPAGARIGIVGRTGAGKTTLVSLMSRFYDPVRGVVLLDGRDVRDYRVRDLRRQFGIVLQEPVLFSTSVAENIAYSRPDANREDLIAAAKAAEAHDFISALPLGYDAVVGERGMRLSGGERQRIALARAFLKDAPVLLLDEPTSSVDIKTEASIMAAMERLMVGRTTIMIAHRLSTLRGCDCVYQLAEGDISAIDLDDLLPSTALNSIKGIRA